MTDAYRPWGPLEWLLPRLGAAPWSLLGTLATEERCVAAASITLPGGLACARFLHIRDPWPSPVEEFESRYRARRATLGELGVTSAQIEEAPLLADLDTIDERLDALLAAASPHVIIDITSMPKWWFFPLVRRLLASAGVETVVATYASATRYARHLSSDPAPLAALPTFAEPPNRASNDELIVGIGFAPLSLRELYAAGAGKIRYLFPFPPGPPNFFRNWEFLRVLETEIENRGMEEQDRWFVHMYDCPSIFAALRRFTNDGRKTAALAPFGPKTMSLAMCAFALAAAERRDLPPVHVFYTQPRRYEPDYTTGIRTVNGRPDVRAYCLKMNGRSVYRLG